MTLDTDKLSRVETAVLTDGEMRASVLNYGAITQEWLYKDRPLILGFNDLSAYFKDTSYTGAIVGRVANRIGGARFDLEGTGFELSANEGENTLHGGERGLSSQFWDLKKMVPNEVLLSYLSRDGESGFPGEVRFEVRISLQFPRLIYSFTAHPDRPTPISLTQHNYYTLGSSDGVDAHKLKLASNQYLEIDHQGIPSGRVCSTAENELDFQESKSIGSISAGIDHYLCFDHTRDPKAPVAVFSAPSGLALTVYSDQPGAQVYSRAKMAKPFRGSSGLCIEPSGYPNAPNIPSFPSIICTPENPYRQVLALEISEGWHEG